MTNWLIQDSFAPYYSINDTTDALEALSVPFKGFGVIPFTDKFLGLDDIDMASTCVVRGSTKILKNLYLTENNSDLSNFLRSGIFYDIKKFDQFYYKDAGLPLFNHGADFINFNQISTFKSDTGFFAKPSADIKFFAGLCVDPELTIAEQLKINKFRVDSDVSDDFKIMISDIKNPPLAEYRAFVVDGDITSIAMYYKNGRLNKSDDVPDCIFPAIVDFISIYSPHDIFTIDVCETEDDIKVMEYNCWNISGFYTKDLAYTIMAINDYQKRKSNVR